MTKPYPQTSIEISASGLLTIYGRTSTGWEAIARTMSASEAIDIAMDWGDELIAET